MGKQSQHNHDNQQSTENQKNEMSDDPGDGARNSFTVGKDGETPVEKKPPHDAQDQSAIEAFGQEGAGIAAKE